MTLGPLTSNMPGVSGGNEAKLSGSTIWTDTPGSGWPTVPLREAGWKYPAARKSGQLTAMTGAHSVTP